MHIQLFGESQFCDASFPLGLLLKYAGLQTTIFLASVLGHYDDHNRRSRSCAIPHDDQDQRSRSSPSCITYTIDDHDHGHLISRSRSTITIDGCCLFLTTHDHDRRPRFSKMADDDHVLRLRSPILPIDGHDRTIAKSDLPIDDHDRSRGQLNIPILLMVAQHG